jgi:hypothetical protein
MGSACRRACPARLGRRLTWRRLTWRRLTWRRLTWRRLTWRVEGVISGPKVRSGPAYIYAREENRERERERKK